MVVNNQEDSFTHIDIYETLQLENKLKKELNTQPKKQAFKKNSAKNSKIYQKEYFFNKTKKNIIKIWDWPKPTIPQTIKIKPHAALQDFQ